MDECYYGKEEQMKIELTAEEVRAAIGAQASTLVLTGKVGDVKQVTIHTAGKATVEFENRHPTPPTVEEAKESARTRAKPADSGATDEKKGKK